MTSAMPADRFWRMIELVASSVASPADQPELYLEGLCTGLSKLSLSELLSFDLRFRLLLDEACTWDLWGAAYLSNGGCSDDGFVYFRSWLISKSRAVYERVLADPDSLAQVEPDSKGDWEFEGIAYAAAEVFAEKSDGQNLYDHLEDDVLPGRQEPGGEPFREDPADLARRHPDLWRRFGNG